jgi:Centromere DNA-binding protein complex CBF3 subunit, domain 2
MKMVRMMGGFSEGHCMHYNPQMNVEVPEELCKMIFPWIETSREEVKQYERETNITKDTAHAFFKGLTMMHRIIIQDAAAIKVQYPERFSGSKFFQLELFCSQQFQVCISPQLVVLFWLCCDCISLAPFVFC